MFTQGKFMGYYWGVGAFLSKHPNGGIPGGFFVNGETNSIWVWDFLNKKWIDSNRVEGPLQGMVDDPATFEPNAKSGIKTTYLHLSNKPGNITFANFLNSGVPIEVSTETNAVIMLFWNGDYWETSVVPIYGDVSDKADKDLTNVTEGAISLKAGIYELEGRDQPFRALTLHHSGDLYHAIGINDNGQPVAGTGTEGLDGYFREKCLAYADLTNVTDEDLVKVLYGSGYDSSAEAFREFITTVPEAIKVINKSAIDNTTSSGSYIVIDNQMNVTTYLLLLVDMSVNTINRKKTYTQKLFGDPAGEVLVREKSGDSAWSEWASPFVSVDLTNVDKKAIQEKVGIYESEYTDDTDASRRFIALKVWDDADNNRSIGITSEGEPFITLLDPEENPERIPLALAKNASDSEAGLMPSSDKQKLDSIEIIEIDLNTADGTEEIADADTDIPFLGNNTFNDIITNVATGTRYLFYYKYTVEDTTYTGNFVFATENDGETGKITFTNPESLVYMIIEKIRPDMPIQIAVTTP